MTERVSRPATAVAIMALLVGACGGTSPAPASSAPAPSQPQATAASAAASGSAAPNSTTAAGGPVEIRWFCCLGTGDAPELVTVEKKVVEEFNASHPNIKLTFEVVAYQGARDALATEIGSGNGPDIVGPVGVGGAEAFHGQWLDLTDEIAKNGYDLGQYAQGAVDFYKIGGEGQVGIPFAIYPSMLFYQKGMFDEAGLKEPPHAYGEKYTMPDGSQRDWDYATIKEIAKLLTVDKNGKDSTQAGFDAKHIVQYGFEPQRDDIRGLGAYFGAGSLLAADGKTVAVPSAWQDGWKWFYDGIWTDHSIMTGPLFQSTDFNPEGYPFCTSKVAMEVNFLWATYCLGGAGQEWDVAAVPSHQGKTTAPLNADTFRILKSTEHPDEAFQVLTYLLGDASHELLQAYGGFPARTADQATFFDGLDAQYPYHVDWDVATAGVAYADNPNFEAFMPAYNETLDRLVTFNTYIQATPGVNMDTEIGKLKSDIQKIWDASS
jgi:multiple sugar transport system substrate-binding protein